MTGALGWSIVVAIIALALGLVLLLQSQQILFLVKKETDTPNWVTGLPYYALIAILLALALVAVFFNGWESHALNWLNLIVRWVHVIIGIAWIGASFYFVFLENSLNRTENVRDELTGNLWAIHGGGFYYVEKYKIAPKVIPKDLHWFKYEAYFTWITGFLLLIIVYYSQARLTMFGNIEMSAWSAIGIGVGSLILGWYFYDVLCKSKLIHHPWLFYLVLLVFVVVSSAILSLLLSPKAAYMHIGAMLGTMMAGNVFKVIIPSQKAMVHAARTGQILDPTLGQHAGLRSLHNNYFTLPVVFIMISNHFPSTFGHPYNWAVLAGLFVVSTGIRHYLNLIEKGQQAFWILPLATLGTIVLAFITAPPKADGDTGELVGINQINTIFENRCLSCHSDNPTDELWVNAPNGVGFDLPQQIADRKDQVMMRVVVTKDMPQGNKTNMTEEERELVRRWILQGARIE